MQLLVVGTLAFDSVKTPVAARDQILGGSAAYAATCASFFCPVQMVGIVGTDFAAEHLAYFRGRGIDVAGVEQAPGRTFRWSGVYEANMNIRHTLETQLNVLEQFHPALPQTFRQTPYLVLGNFDPSLQLEVLKQLQAPRLVACDTMNFWIKGYRAALDRTLAEVDLLLVNDSEARDLSGCDDLGRAASAIRRMGPQTLVIKLGEQGAELHDEAGCFRAPAARVDRVVDPTGAGDSFAGGMLGYVAARDRVDGRTLREAMVLGTLMASFSVQDFSIDGVRALSTEQIGARLSRYLGETGISIDAAAALATLRDRP